MTVNGVILNAVWINENTSVIIKYKDPQGVVHTLAEGAWFSDQVRHWRQHRVVNLAMDFDAGEAVFFIV